VPSLERLRFDLAALQTDLLVALLKDVPDAVEQVRTLQEDEDQIATTTISVYELVKGACFSQSKSKGDYELEEQ